MKKISNVGVGIVGCGFIANFKHLPALKNIKEADVVAVFDSDRKKAEEVAANYGNEAIVYNSIEELLSDNRVDTVYVLTSNGTHSEYAIKAMEAGRHVLCEKPMALNVEEAERMLETSERTGKKLTIGFQNRLLPSVQYLKKMSQEGKFGEIYYAKSLAVRRRSIPAHGSFLNKKIQGGGCLIDMGVHAIDMALYLMNNYEVDSVMGNTYNYLGKRPTSTNANGIWKAEDFQVEDSAFAMVRMKNGATLQIECSWALNTLQVYENKVVLCGTEAGADMLDGVRINGESCGELIITKPDVEHKMSADPDYFFAMKKEPVTESRLWIDAIINDTEPFVKAREAYTVSKIIDGIYRSAEIGESVKL